MCHVDPSEVPVLKACNTSVVHCPAASMRVAMGASIHGQFPELVAAGVNVCLGAVDIRSR